jgi:cytochrome c-type biogenesis protein CcmH
MAPSMQRRQRISGLFGAIALILALLQPAFAVQPDEILRDPALESRARALSKDLRCMVCQNQSIDDSDAPLARDLRLLVRERLQAGDSDKEVIDFLVARYGEFVQLKPRFSLETALLWLGPVLLLLAAIGVLLSWRRRAAPSGEAAALTQAEERRLAALLDAGDEKNADDPSSPPPAGA